MLLDDETKKLDNNKELAEESEFLEGNTFSTVLGGLPRVLLLLGVLSVAVKCSV